MLWRGWLIEAEASLEAERLQQPQGLKGRDSLGLSHHTAVEVTGLYSLSLCLFLVIERLGQLRSWIWSGEEGGWVTGRCFNIQEQIIPLRNLPKRDVAIERDRYRCYTVHHY